ncbi:transposase, partial [Photobacterium nomapromontoriensis]
MPKNMVQFQKSISIHRFIKLYGTEEQCQKHLFDMRWPTAFKCPNCHHDK